VTTEVTRYDGGEEPVVMGDADQLTQLLLNIAINGVQAMAGRGGGTLSFSVFHERHGGKGYFCVGLKNDGPPIPEDQRERIFDPFYTTKDGLSICSRIADQHDGHLAVLNLPEGRGVEFTLALAAGGENLA
jgi:signal transduction histidine kinase